MKQSAIIVEQAQISADPASPSSGFSTIYPKTDDDWYTKSPGGIVRKLMFNPMTTSQDLIVGGSSGLPTRLAVGANGTVLSVEGGSIVWVSSTGIPAGGTAGQILGKVTNDDYDAAWIPYPTLEIFPGDGILIDGENNISIDEDYISSLISGSPAGADSYLQFNDADVFGADSELTFNKTLKRLTSQNFTAKNRIIINPTGEDYEEVTGTAELGPGVYLRGIVTNDSVDVNEHGFVDGTTFARAGKAYCAFDSQAILSGANAFDHFAGFQQRGQFSGSNTLSTYYSFSSAPQITGTGTVTNFYHFGNPAFATYTGTITNEYGLYIKTLGGSNTFGVWVQSDKSYFGGNVGIGETSPGYPLTIHKDGTDLGVLNWVNNTQILNTAGTKGFNLGYSSTANYGIIGSQGASSGVAFVSHNGSGWGYRFYIGTDGTINWPDFAGTGERSLGVDADGRMVIMTGSGGSQWDDVTGGINYAGGNVGINEVTPGYPLTIHKDGTALGVLNWEGLSQITNGAATKGFNLGYLTTGNYGVIGSQGASSGLTIVTHNGTAFGHRLIFSTDGTISIPEFAGGGDQLLGVNNAGTIVIGTGGGGGMTNPMTTAGDLIVGGSSGTPGRLGIGANGTVLTSNGSAASWQSLSSSVTTIINNLFPQTAIFYGTTTDTTETFLTGTMLMPVGEAGYLDINVAANNDDNTGSYIRRLLVPYRVTSSSVITFQSQTDIMTVRTWGSNPLTGCDIAFYSDGAGGLDISVFGNGDGIAWEVTVIKYKAAWTA